MREESTDKDVKNVQGVNKYKLLLNDIEKNILWAQEEYSKTKNKLQKYLIKVRIENLESLRSRAQVFLTEEQNKKGGGV